MAEPPSPLPVRHRGDKRQRQDQKRYRHDDVKTPLACLAILSCTGLVEFKKGVTLKALQARAKAKAQTDLALAQQMQRAKADLFELINKPRPRRQA